MLTVKSLLGPFSSPPHPSSVPFFWAFSLEEFSQTRTVTVIDRLGQDEIKWSKNSIVIQVSKGKWRCPISTQSSKFTVYIHVRLSLMTTEGLINHSSVSALTGKFKTRGLFKLTKMPLVSYLKKSLHTSLSGPSVTPSIKFAGTQLYTWVERGTVRSS